MKIIIDDLNKEINIYINYFINFINKIYVDKISIYLIENIQVKHINDKIINLSSIIMEKFDTVIIIPNKINYLNYIYKSIIENNFLNFNITKENNNIKIKMQSITNDRRIKIILFLKKESEKIKINIRNIRRSFNNKVKFLFENKKINKDEKNKILKNIDIQINNKIIELEKILKNKEIKLLKII